MKLPSSCLVCGRRVPAGANHCDAHAAGAGRRASCQVCGKPTAGELYCPQHVPTEEDRLRRFPYRTGYQDPEYRRNRRQAWERDGGRCTVCGAPVSLDDCETHHVRPLSRGGGDEAANLRTVHHDCHPRGKHGRIRTRRPT